jgi:hypothetical protein
MPVTSVNENPDKPRATFSKKLSEIAVGAGAGLRFDFSFLRTDLAFYSKTIFARR